MSVSVECRWRATRDQVETARRVALRVLFGDRLGLVIFLGTLCFVGLYWRIGLFITDNYTLANGLASLADGQLAVEDVVYGGRLDTPGMYEYDGNVYARNYGQLAFALPFLWALEALTVVADPGLVVPVVWSLLVVALCSETGRVLDRPSLGLRAGAVCGLGFFLANAAVARPLEPRMLPLVALQISTIVAAALVATALYRLFTRMHSARSGLVVGLVTVVATPVGFWASIPKRHVPIIALLMGICYALYRSREEPSPDALVSPLGFRGIAYALVGLMTWIHPGEAFAIFLALVAVDVPTAPSNDRRSIGIVTAIFFLSLLPFFLTNVLISGDPLRPPRMLNSFSDVTADSGFDSGSVSGSGSDTESDSGGVFSRILAFLPPVFAGVVSEGEHRIDLLFAPFLVGIETIIEQPEAVYRTLVRGGYIERIASEDNSQAINLSLIEGAPVVAGILSVVAIIAAGTVHRIRHLRERPLVEAVQTQWRHFKASPGTTTDAFVVLSGLLFLLMYIQRLPLHAQVTVRYLLPLYPFAVYGIARQESIRRVLSDHGRLALWSWAIGVLLGGQLLLAIVVLESLATGEAFQVHALLGIAAGSVFALFAIGSTFTDRVDRLTAIAAGGTVALGTDFLLLSGFLYFQYGQYALPVAGRIAELLPTA